MLYDGALGVDYLISGEATRVGSQYVLTLSLVDVERALVVRRASEKASSMEGLAGALPGTVASLLEPLGLGQPAPSQGPQLIGYERPYGGWLFWGGLAAGTLLVATGGYLVIDANARQASHERGIEMLTHSEAVQLEGRRGAGIVLFGLGVGAILSGVFFDAMQPVYGEQAGAAPAGGGALTVLPLGDGVHLSVTIRY